MRNTKHLELTHKCPVSEIDRIFSLFRNGRFNPVLDNNSFICVAKAVFQSRNFNGRNNCQESHILRIRSLTTLCESNLLDSKLPKKRIQKMELNIVGAGL